MRNDLLVPHHLTVAFRANSPVVSVFSSGPPPPATPASRRLVILMLPRLRTRGSLMSPFNDSARWRWPLVSPADVRLKMARRPRREDERVSAASLAPFTIR